MYNVGAFLLSAKRIYGNKNFVTSMRNSPQDIVAFNVENELICKQ